MEILWSSLQRGIIFDELYNQGFTNCGILPFHMGEHRVSLGNMDDMENMENLDNMENIMQTT